MEKVDVIVIGAGISGLTAAYELKQKNKKVIVLEKNDYLGGRMSVKVIDNIPLSLGAQFITSFYKNMNNYIKKFNLKTEKLTIGKLAIKRDDYYHEFDSDNPFSLLFYKGLSLKNKLRLLFGLLVKLIEARKIDIYNIESLLPFDNKSSYKDLINFIDKEGMDYFIDPMLNSLFGYSSKDFSRALFLSILTKLFDNKLYSFKDGINQLILKLSVQLDVRENIEVVSIKRLKDKVTVFTKNEKNSEHIFEADKIIIAIPGNKVLDILTSPKKEERDFFSKIEYSKLGYFFLKSKENLPLNAETVWLPLKESRSFASFGKIKKLKNVFYYSVELRENTVNKIMSSKDVNLRNLIEKELGFKNFEIIYSHLWDSALPKFKPGYLTAMYRFKNTMKKNNTIFYCGDYLENPSTEGALTSGLKVAQLIIN